MTVCLRALLIVSLTTCAFVTKSQSFYKYKNGKSIQVLFGAGITSYSGELREKHTFQFTNPNVSAGAQLYLNSRIGIRGEITWYRISGADNAEPTEDVVHRNLSFTANNLELSIAPVVYLFPEKTFSATAFPLNIYVTAFVGVTYFNPKAEYQGKSYRLRPLKTEGVEYGQIALIFPVGFGVKYRLSKDFAFSLEASYRFTRTDYLDDVSTVYVSQSFFADPVASVLADRRKELGFKPSPAGSTRGTPKANDGYLMVGLKLGYALSSNNADHVRRYR